jgi:PAS domain S-box-containing protein
MDEAQEYATNEPGMNFISVDFELIMVNRTNERVYGKPAAALLGKKCYREFERREEPCPHCPGRLALATGESQATEAIGLHADGTRLYARIRAHPVLGPDNRPTGFIEVVEDISEQKRAESVSAIETDLQSALVPVKNVPRALREALEAALHIEGIEWGCVFLVNRETDDQDLVYQRGVSPADLPVLQGRVRERLPLSAAHLPGAPSVLEALPIIHRGRVVATMVVGGASYQAMPSTLKAGLLGLGVITGNAISRIWAEQSRGDAVADLEAFITMAPVATWVLDLEGRVTMWNKAAERLLGWQADEVLRQLPPFGDAHVQPQPTRLFNKEGAILEVRLHTAPFRDVVGNGSTLLVMAEDLTRAPSGREGAPSITVRRTAREISPRREGGKVRVLIVDGGEPWGQDLACIISSLGYEACRQATAADAAPAIREALAGGRPFMLAVVGMVYADRTSGLDEKATLRALGFEAPVVVSSDLEVRGHEHFDIAGVLTRPYEAATVSKALDQVLELDRISGPHGGRRTP